MCARAETVSIAPLYPSLDQSPFRSPVPDRPGIIFIRALEIVIRLIFLFLAKKIQTYWVWGK